jgi:hypothetical protein
MGSIFCPQEDFKDHHVYIFKNQSSVLLRNQIENKIILLNIKNSIEEILYISSYL